MTTACCHCIQTSRASRGDHAQDSLHSQYTRSHNNVKQYAYSQHTRAHSIRQQTSSMCGCLATQTVTDASKKHNSTLGLQQLRNCSSETIHKAQHGSQGSCCLHIWSTTDSGIRWHAVAHQPISTAMQPSSSCHCSLLQTATRHHTASRVVILVLCVIVLQLACPRCPLPPGTAYHGEGWLRMHSIQLYNVIVLYLDIPDTLCRCLKA